MTGHRLKKVLSFCLLACLGGCLIGFALSGCSSKDPSDNNSSSGSTTLKEEHVTSWNEYKVTAPQEITFTVLSGDPACYGVREVHEESGNVLRVGVIQGIRQDAPEICTAVGVYEEIKIETTAPAEQLTVEEMPAEEITLNS